MKKAIIIASGIFLLFFAAAGFLSYREVKRQEAQRKEVRQAENENEELSRQTGLQESIEEAEEESQAIKSKIETAQVEQKPAVKKQLPRSISRYGLIFYPPMQYKKDSMGRMVCAHDNDKPKTSKKDKPVHIDVQCCLDPDEIPNPYCHYPREKYGKILDDFERKKEKMLRRHREGKGM